ncbi:MAG TPA: tetratricopeptide repeat protein [Leptolyngbyaceae cyanobacterium]
MTPFTEHDQTAETWNGRGCSFCENSQFTEALDAFNRALAFNPNYCTAWNNRGNALCGLNRSAEALSAYDKAIALNPTYHQALFNRGKLLAEMGAYGNALESYERAISLEADPRYLHAREDIWLKGKLFSHTRIV